MVVPVIPTCRGLRQDVTSGGQSQPGQYNEFRVNQSYTVRPYLKANNPTIKA